MVTFGFHLIHQQAHYPLDSIRLHVPMKQLTIVFISILALGHSAVASPLVPTNMDLMVKTTKDVVEDALTEIASGDSGLSSEVPVLVEAEADHDANWLVEHIVIEALLARGFQVRVDTAGTDDSGSRLSYRIVDLGISGWSGLMGSSVNRECRVTVSVRVSDLHDDTLRLQHEVSRRLRDHVPKSRMDVLQNENFDFVDTELEEQNWGKFVEPAIVTSLLGSLIYLFFSNR